MSLAKSQRCNPANLLANYVGGNALGDMDNTNNLFTNEACDKRGYDRESEGPLFLEVLGAFLINLSCYEF
jgi:hypothetical protein